MVNSPLTGPGAIISLVILGIILTLRVTRFALNQLGRARYRPASPQPNRTATPDNCSVILPILYPHDPNLEDCVHSILANFPAHLYIVTVGIEARNQVESKLGHLRALYGATQINVGAVNKANKRRQIAHALSNISTSVTAITGQGVYWPKTFLGSALLPFDNVNVAAVTVPELAYKPVVPKSAWRSLWACLISFYDALLADENRAVNALDHSALFGGSTVLFRSYHCATEEFKKKFENETCFFGRSGVLKEDEHCFLNRHFLQDACDVAFQDTPEATIQVDHGSVLEFMGEYLRTTRNTWRLSISMLTHETLWIHPLGCFLTWLSSLVSFTVLTDMLIIILMYYNGIFDETLVLWLGVGISLLIIQLLVALQVASRLGCSGGKFNWFTVLTCIILSFPAGYALELLRIVALLTFWKVETEDCKPPDLEQGGERYEPPWIWGFMEMIDTPPSWDPESENAIFTIE